MAIIIKNSKELKKYLDKDKNLHLENENVRIEYQVEKGEMNDVYCQDLFLMDDSQKFNFNGRNFNGGNFNGRDFNGWNFNGGDFNGRNFNGWDFNGKKISYFAFFNCYGSIKCESYEGRRKPHAEPVCLDGKIEIIKPILKEE